MKKILSIIFAVTALIFMFVSCKEKPKNITFKAVIQEVNSDSILVSTKDDVGFDVAVVRFLNNVKINFDLDVSKTIELEILPNIRDSYPVQVTAVNIKEIKENNEEKEESKMILEKIDAKKAKEMIDNKEYDIILDVRTKAEYDEGHIKGGTLIPDNEIKTKAESTIPDKDSVILVYCRSGRRSASAAKELNELGYKKVYDFGGIMDWPYEIEK